MNFPPEQLLRVAQQQRQANNPGLAEATLREILARHPNHDGALHALGNLLCAVNRRDEAIAAYRAAIAANPQHLEAHGSLGVTLCEVGRKAEASQAFERALAISAAPQYLSPQFAVHHFRFGLLLQSVQELNLAAESFRRAIQLAPERPEPHESLGRVYETLGRKSEAIAHYRLAVQKGAAEPEALFHMAGLIGDGFPPQQPPDSVARLFDKMAAGFDAHLESLQYSAPRNLCNALLKLTPADPQANFGDVVDLGCGTGLCGELLRPHAKSLVGIDLSPGMLAKAREKNIYDALVQSELVHALLERPDCFDLAVAADVFIYIGDLAPVFAALGTSLRKGGLLAFSIEISDGADYQLLPTRRYCQSHAYIQRLAEAHGFSRVSSFTGPLREETPEVVVGSFVILRKQ